MSINYRLTAVAHNGDVYEGLLPDSSCQGQILTKEELQQIYHDVQECHYTYMSLGIHQVTSVQEHILDILKEYSD